MISFICSENGGLKFSLGSTITSTPFPVELLAVYGVNLPQTQNLLLKLCEISLGAMLNFPKVAFEFKLYRLACAKCLS